MMVGKEEGEKMDANNWAEVPFGLLQVAVIKMVTQYTES